MIGGSLHRTWNGSSTTPDAFSTEGSSTSSGIATGRAAGPSPGLRVLAISTLYGRVRPAHEVRRCCRPMAQHPPNRRRSRRVYIHGIQVVGSWSAISSHDASVYITATSEFGGTGTKSGSENWNDDSRIVRPVLLGRSTRAAEASGRSIVYVVGSPSRLRTSRSTPSSSRPGATPW